MNVGTNDREHPNSSPISSPPRQLHGGAPFLNDGFGKQVSCVPFFSRMSPMNLFVQVKSAWIRLETCGNQVNKPWWPLIRLALCGACM